jgi:hypothetical protein
MRSYSEKPRVCGRRRSDIRAGRGEVPRGSTHRGSPSAARGERAGNQPFCVSTGFSVGAHWTYLETQQLSSECARENGTGLGYAAFARGLARVIAASITSEIEVGGGPNCERACAGASRPSSRRSFTEPGTRSRVTPARPSVRCKRRARHVRARSLTVVPFSVGCAPLRAGGPRPGDCTGRGGW